MSKGSSGASVVDAEPGAELESQPTPSHGDPSIEEVLLVQESRPHTPIDPTSPKGNPFRFPSVGPDSLSSNLETTTYDLYGLDTLDASPAKSLSSLAGSDSESDDEGKERTLDNPSEFNPQFTSTQKPGLDCNLASNAVLNAATSSDNLGWANDKLSSTSQLQAEVNSQVDEFDKFMEADLGYDLVTPRL
jgi:hypothetical protein